MSMELWNMYGSTVVPGVMLVMALGAFVIATKRLLQVILSDDND